jgi:hypothetical protein
MPGDIVGVNDRGRDHGSMKQGCDGGLSAPTATIHGQNPRSTVSVRIEKQTDEVTDGRNSPWTRQRLNGVKLHVLAEILCLSTRSKCWGWNPNQPPFSLDRSEAFCKGSSCDRPRSMLCEATHFRKALSCASISPVQGEQSVTTTNHGILLGTTGWKPSLLRRMKPRMWVNAWREGIKNMPRPLTDTVYLRDGGSDKNTIWTLCDTQQNSALRAGRAEQIST